MRTNYETILETKNYRVAFFETKSLRMAMLRLNDSYSSELETRIDGDLTSAIFVYADAIVDKRTGKYIKCREYGYVIANEMSNEMSI